jgi:hypothetical protein
MADWLQYNEGGDDLLRIPEIAMICAAALALTLEAPSAHAEKRERVWAKVGADAVAVRGDLGDCTTQSLNVHPVYSLLNLYVGDVAPGWDTFGTTFGHHIFTAEQEAQAHGAYLKHCMKQRGYIQLTLTPEAAADFDAAQSPEAHKAWANAFYGVGLSARIAAAAASAPAPLLNAVEEPFTLGGVRFDPTTLAPATGDIVKNQAALSGTIGHRRTARLKTDFTLAVQASALQSDVFHADAGTVFHQVVYAGSDDPVQTYWCAPLTGTRIYAPYKINCLWTDENGYAVIVSSGQPWLAGYLFYDDARTVRAPGGPLALEYSQDDLLGPLDFKLMVRRVDAKGVLVDAEATKDGKTEGFWTAHLAFDETGAAILPFWTHRLVLTRSGDHAVKAAFSADGDGKGWFAAILAPY